jgi:hypothetical protein
MMECNFSFRSLAAWRIEVVPPLPIHYVWHFYEENICKSHPQRSKNYAAALVQGTLWKTICVKT